MEKATLKGINSHIPLVKGSSKNHHLNEHLSKGLDMDAFLGGSEGSLFEAKSLVGGSSPTHLVQNLLVKWDPFPKLWGENSKIFELPPR